MNTETFSVRLDRSAKARLQKLAKSTGRSRAFLAAEAIVAYPVSSMAIQISRDPLPPLRFYRRA